MPVLTKLKLEEIQRQQSPKVKVETIAIANDISQESLNGIEVWTLTQDLDL